MGNDEYLSIYFSFQKQYISLKIVLLFKTFEFCSLIKSNTKRQIGHIPTQQIFQKIPG